MRIGPSGARFTLAACIALAPVACGSRAPSAKFVAPPVATARTLSFDDLLGRAAEVAVTLHPPMLARDRIYGPLLRRASAMAAAYAGPRTVGTTALAALERTEEVVVASNDATAEAVIVLRGVPADLDAARIVDERARPIWREVVGDVGRNVVEYEPVTPADAALFVLPRRLWIIAVGDTRARTREALLGPISASSLLGEEAPLAVLSIQGPALVRREARLREGALGSLGRSLVRASFELAPGAQGLIDARFVYAETAAACASEQTVREVVAAFRRRLESLDPPSLAWLAAAGVERSTTTVAVHAPIPKAWIHALAQADVAPLSAGVTAPPGSATPPGSDELPWQLWHRPASPRASGLTPSTPQDSSQPGGSL
jgi:hypothetical protein